ncbi:MAG: class I SAM-dependent methyltransferase [Planctomycetes bacterium]|nr:class I SAM-dependent methyltransferase [Planctomycetota bacterium]
MTNKKDFDAKEHFGDKHATIYDEKIRKVIRGYGEMHDLSYYLLKDNLQETAEILVSGIGTGNEAITYARGQKSWHIFGVDPTPEMVQSAKKKISQLGLTNQIEVIEGKVENIEKIDFDAATSILVMQFLKDNGDKEKYLQNISTKLKKGAKLILIDLEGEKNSANFNLLLSAWKCHQYCTRADTEQIDKDFENVDSDLQFIAEKRINELLQAIGFIKVCKFYQSYLFGGYISEKA